MKRLLTVVTLTAAATLLATPAQANPTVCATWNVSINGEAQSGSQCLPA
ncbi:hypothetical protein ACFP3Q_09490 [Nocardioides sp. GCM10027113]